MYNSSKKILVVEDDVEMLNKLASGLMLSNFQIFQATDGEEAVRLVIDEKPDLVLLDLLLPKLDGFGVLERIRKYPSEDISKIKVVILSNLWSNKDILRAEALAISEYFVKSNTNLQDVFKKVKELLSGN